MLYKTCPKCKENKSIDKFPADKNKKYGVGVYCKQCKNTWKKENGNRLYENVAENRKQNKDYQNKIPSWWITNNAIRSGALVRPEVCSVCKTKTKVEAHHEDYTKPLEVVWVCKSCHIELDRVRRIKL